MAGSPKQTQTYSRAVAPTAKFDVSSVHYTTANFMGNRVVYYREMAPKQTIDIDLAHSIRTAPLNAPAFNHISGVFSAFFVPYSYIWTKFNEFIAQSLRNGALVGEVPTMTMGNLVNAFLDVSGILTETSNGTASDYDFWYYGSGSTKYYIKCTSEPMRNMLATLTTLGYRFGNGVPVTGGTSTTSLDDAKVSALPLLVYDKVWFDYFRLDTSETFPFEPDMATSLSVSQICTILGRMAKQPVQFAQSYFCNNVKTGVMGDTNFVSVSANHAPAINQVLPLVANETATVDDGLDFTNVTTTAYRTNQMSSAIS